jgi:hypothetical protein
MATKKKHQAFLCPHCSQEFGVEVKFCQRCESHVVPIFWSASKEVCARCSDGANDAYIEWKKGHEARVQVAVEAANDPKNWGDGKESKAYAEWVNSPEYEKRFEHHG